MFFSPLQICRFAYSLEIVQLTLVCSGELKVRQKNVVIGEFASSPSILHEPSPGAPRTTGTINSRAPASAEMAPRRTRNTTDKNSRDFRATARDPTQRSSTAPTEQPSKYLRESSVGSINLSSGAKAREEGYRSDYGLDRNTGNVSQNLGKGARNANVRTGNMEIRPKNGAGGRGVRPRSSLVDRTSRVSFVGRVRWKPVERTSPRRVRWAEDLGGGGSRSTRTGKRADDAFVSAAERELSRAIISRTSAGGDVSCSQAERPYTTHGGPVGESEAQAGGVRVAGAEEKAFIVNVNLGQPQPSGTTTDGTSLERKMVTSSTVKPKGPKKLSTPGGAKSGISKGGTSAGDLTSAGKIEDSQGTLVVDYPPFQSNTLPHAAKDDSKSRTPTPNIVISRRYDRGDSTLRNAGRSVEVGDGERRRADITEAAERFWSGDW